MKKATKKPKNTLTPEQRVEAKKVIPFQNEFSFISPYDIENMLEKMDDMGYLSKKGKDFRSAFWFFFIKKD